MEQKEKRKRSQEMPGWLSQLGVCLRLRKSQSTSAIEERGGGREGRRMHMATWVYSTKTQRCPLFSKGGRESPPLAKEQLPTKEVIPSG